MTPGAYDLPSAIEDWRISRTISNGNGVQIMYRLLIALILVSQLGACSTFSYSSQPYSSSMQNSLSLKQMKKDGASGIAVGSFVGENAAEREITCRATGPVLPAGAPSFGEYIRTALINELNLADLYDPRSAKSVSVNFSKIDFDSLDGEWFINGQVSIAGGGSFNVAVTHRYGRGMGMIVDTVCTQTAQAFNAAVQEFVNKVISHPEFQSLAR